MEFAEEVKGDCNMEFAIVITPILIAGVIGLYVINSLKHLANEGKVGKKKSKGAQIWIDSLIPLGMIFGCAIGVIFGLFSQFSLLLTINLGTVAGYLFGFFAYKRCSARQETIIHEK